VPRLPDRPVVVQAETVILRAFNDDDLAPLCAAFADEDIVRWNPGPVPPETAQTWMARRADWSGGDHASWALAALDGSLVGSVSLHRIDWEQADAEIGYWTAPWARRRGLASAGLAVATRFAHDSLSLNRVYLHHAVANLASCAVATRAGYRHEGTLRKSHRYPDGQYHDEHLHAHLVEDEVQRPHRVDS
jgi:RimJ/RimL family protein N-acetyltransferase